MSTAKTWSATRASGAVNSPTEVNYDHSALHAHFGENLRRIRPQHLPPVGIGHRGCREKAVRHAAAARMMGFAFDSFNHSGE
jgi:hypothetical protein